MVVPWRALSPHLVRDSPGAAHRDGRAVRTSGGCCRRQQAEPQDNCSCDDVYVRRTYPTQPARTHINFRLFTLVFLYSYVIRSRSRVSHFSPYSSATRLLLQVQDRPSPSVVILCINPPSLVAGSEPAGWFYGRAHVWLESSGWLIPGVARVGVGGPKRPAPKQTKKLL